MKIKHKRHLRRSKGFSLVELLVVIAIIAGLAAVSYGPIMKQVKAAGQTQAIAKGKNLHTALFSFAKDNDGLYPSDDDVNGGGSSSNDYLEVLLKRNLVGDEKEFWIKENKVLDHTANKKPENDKSLDGGENSWLYVKGLDTSSRPNLPLLADSWSSGTSFDTEIWEGKVIIVRLDGSITAEELNFGDSPFTDDGESQQVNYVETRGGNEVDIFAEEQLKGGEVTTPESGS